MESAAFRETSMNPKNKYDTTPFLKDLAGKSLVFTNYYTGFAASTRSFFSALHGLYPYVDQSPDVTKYSQLKIPNLVSILREQGYSTGFFASSDTLFDSLDTLIAALPYDAYMDKNLLLKEDPENVSIGSWGVDEEAMIDKALEWIAEVKDSGRPFYVSYNAVYPHHPFDVPKQHVSLYDMDWGNDGLKSRYRASLNYADMSVRRFYEGLERLGVLKDTLFVVTSDHGETFGDVHKNNLIHAEYCYDEDTHIFLILHNSDALGAPVRNERMGFHADLLPTLLDVLDINRGLDIDGQSLVSKNFEERMIFCCSRRGLSVRDGDFKFVTLKSGGRPELYDLSKDPDEQNDISSSNREKTAAYEKAVRNWRVSVLAAYRERVKKVGLSEKEVENLARQNRDRIFAGVRAGLSGTAICLLENRSDCGSSGKEPSFAKGKSLVVEARVKKPGRLGLQVDVFDPNGVKISKQKTPHQNVSESIYADLQASLFQTAGRYRARVLLLSSHAAHDSAVIYFNIKE
jgi:arylsulfatase A-like enzyme